MQYNGTLAGGPTTFYSESGWTQPGPIEYPGFVQLQACQWVGNFAWFLDVTIPAIKETGLTPAGDYVGEEWIPYPGGVGERGGRVNATLTEITP